MKIIYLWPFVKLARMPIVFAVIPLFFIGVLFALRTGAEFSLGNFLWGFSILFIIEKQHKKVLFQPHTNRDISKEMQQFAQ